ncbi:MAG: hypothetical protein J7L54_06105 [Elusimicrobia bacterium]|nr:hypothetical protein [Elusimicrobiota bacterium]
MNPKTIEIRYEFDFDDGKKVRFEILLDSPSMTVLPGDSVSSPEWARMENFRCSVCELESEYCPLAENLVELIEKFSEIRSTEEVNVTVQTPERTFKNKLPSQKGISSLLGIYIAGSRCPVMKKLKPMLRYHLPFATIEETIFRATSAYLLGQYFIYKNGGKPDWDMAGLKEIYKKIEKVNENIASRLRDVIKKDASVNALVILDVFAKFVPISLEASLAKLKYLYSGWIK